MHAIPQSHNLKGCKTLGEDWLHMLLSNLMKGSMCFREGFKTKVKQTKEKKKKKAKKKAMHI